MLTHLSHRRLDAVVAVGEPAAETGYGLLLAREDIFLAVASDHPLGTRERLD